MDVKGINLLKLFETLGRKCDIDIFGKTVISNKVISTKFENMGLEKGIKCLIWIAPLENYALMYRKDVGSECTVSHIFFFPGGVEVSNPYHLV